jgi:hypothetical protein
MYNIAKTLRTFLLFLLISLGFLTSFTTVLLVLSLPPVYLVLCFSSTSTSFCCSTISILYLLLRLFYAACVTCFTFLLLPPLSPPYSGTSLPTATSGLSCGPVLCTHSSACCTPKIYLVQCLYYYAPTTVVEMESSVFSLFFFSTLATLDTFNLFLCPNPALSFTVVSI